MIIAVQNLSTLVADKDVYNMVLLVNAQLRNDVAPAWGLLPPRVEFLPVAPSAMALPAGMPAPHFDALIGVLDDADQAGDLGYHTEGPDADYYGRVFARPVLDNGGNTLSADLSVCSVLSHECCEALLDPSCDLWAQRADGTLIARELCDPVESDSYLITIAATSGETVSGTVSDFVLPSWFDESPAPGATDHMGLLTGSFQVRPTGYAIVMSGGTVSEVWGDRFPYWRRAAKMSLPARTARRDPAVAAACAPTSLA